MTFLPTHMHRDGVDIIADASAVSPSATNVRLSVSFQIQTQLLPLNLCVVMKFVTEQSQNDSLPPGKKINLDATEKRYGNILCELHARAWRGALI